MSRDYRPWTPTELDTLHDALARGLTAPEIARLLDCDVARVRNKVSRSGIGLLQRARAAVAETPAATDAPLAVPPPPPVAATDEVTRTETTDGVTLTVDRGERITTLDALLAAAEVDLTVWAVDKWTANSWEVAAKQEDGTTALTTVWQIKAHLKRIPGADLLAELRAALVADVRAAVPPRAPIVLPRPADEPRRHLCVVSLFDVHFGKLAWAEEAGADYDLRIAADRFAAAVDDLLAESRGWPIARYVLPLGNDVLQVDSAAGTTTSGTHVDTDSRYIKAFRTARRCASEAIGRLAEVAGVHVPIVPGNHDRQSAWMLGEVLDAEFAANPRVSFDNTARLRKYVRYGTNIIGLAHGSEEKHADLPLIMAQEQREAWGETRCRVWLTGHLHRKSEVRHTAGMSFKGVRVFTLPALCSADAWHVQHGYIGETPSAEAHIFHFDRGYRAHIESPVLDAAEVAHAVAA